MSNSSSNICLFWKMEIKMEEKSEFYTLTGYKLKNQVNLTEAMEDYLEMIYRISLSDKIITIKKLAQELNVQPSSVSKMCHKLATLNYISFEKYSTIYLEELGQKIGNYLLWRHNLIEKFLKKINKNDYDLEQVEKIEHFIDFITLTNLEKFLQQ